MVARLPFSLGARIGKPAEKFNEVLLKGDLSALNVPRRSRFRKPCANVIHRPFVRSPAARTTGPKGRRPLVAYKYMDHSESSRILRAVLKRRGHVHFVYTGGAREVFNHERQLKAMFREVEFDGLVTLDHVPHVEHTQLLEEDRRTLVEAIARRLTWAGRPGGEARARSDKPGAPGGPWQTASR